MPKRLWKSLPWVLGLACLFFLLQAASVLSRSIGFFQDELWDFTPAVRMIHGDYVAPTQQMWILGVPVHLVTGPYMGALKTWVVAPLLLLLGTSPRFILTLNVAFGVIYLSALYWALLPALGRNWACLVFAAPLVDTNFLLTAPMDAGPNLFQYLFISLALGAMFRYLADPQPKHYWMAWFFSGCILAQKLTSIPIVMSFAVMLLLLARKNLPALARKHQKGSAALTFLAIPAAVFLIPLIPHLIYFLRSGFGDLFSMTTTGPRTPYFAVLDANFSYFRAMFDGIDWYRRIALDSRPMTAPFPLWSTLGLAAMAFSLALYPFSRVGKKCGRYAAVCIWLFIAGFFLFPVFRELNRPWHLYALTPIFTAGWVTAFVFVYSWIAARSRRWLIGARVAGLTLLAGILALGAGHGLEMLRRVEACKGMSVTSPAIYDAFQAIKEAKLKMVYAINYSLDAPIYVLSKGAIQIEDLTWTALKPEKIDELLSKIETDPEAGILYRYCGSKEWDLKWMKWLNREPDIHRLEEKLEAARPRFQVFRCIDGRQTEFVLITRGPQ